MRRIIILVAVLLDITASSSLPLWSARPEAAFVSPANLVRFGVSARPDVFSHSVCAPSSSGLFGKGMGRQSVHRVGVERRFVRDTRMSSTWAGTGDMGHEEDEGEEFFESIGDAWESLVKVFVLLFNPRTDNEGIYTLQIKRRDGRLENTIVIFEDSEDAERYSGLLEAQDFPSPNVEVLEPSEIKDFATSAGYQTTFIPKGTLFMPPETNVDVTERGWSPEGKDVKGVAMAQEETHKELDALRKNLERLYSGGQQQ